jgi:uroporphyrin-III C-methyltransferase
VSARFSVDASVAEAPGRALLVGAGPGDPDLLTVRAERALGIADLVLYDALVNPRVLDLAPRAQRFYVGKRAGRPAISQSTIHALMIRAAKRGRVVVRLKAGDPFVLGRGGEEAIACEAAGIPVEVIPGVSSAIAGPGAVGIPVTHRDVSPGFLVLSAVPAVHYERVLENIPPGAITVVLLMALGARREIAEFLCNAGWPGDLPAAVVVGAHTPGVWSWTGTLGTLHRAQIPEDRAHLPGLIVIGPVVSLADTVSRAMQREKIAERLPCDPEEEETPWLRKQAP